LETNMPIALAPTIRFRFAAQTCLLAAALGAVTAARAEPPQTIGSIERLDPALDALVPPDAQLQVIAEGFDWIEGPVWVPQDGGFLLFSDLPPNTIFRWDANSGSRAYLKPSGYTTDAPRGGEVGSNGLALDRQGRLLLCQHGDRRVARLDAPWSDPEPRYVTVADRYDGRRFNSPNDVAVHSSGAIYFTDPPYGLDGYQADETQIPGKEIPFQGVYRVTPDGAVTLLTKELKRPNGIAFSPDEKTLYVSNSYEPHAVWMAYPVQPDGLLGPGRVLLDATDMVGKQPGLPDGMALDEHGNLFAAGPGGVWIITPEGKHLGTLNTTQATGNCTFGEDGHTLFITADGYLLRVRLATKGLGF
jgi:gluconolactonase